MAKFVAVTGSYYHDTPAKEALLHAIKKGANVINVSPGWQEGESEAEIGRILRGLFDKGELKREEVFLVAKTGIVRGAQGQYIARGIAETPNDPKFASMVELEDGAYYSSNETFIRESVQAICNRLGIETVDLVLLETPDIFCDGTDPEYLALTGHLQSVFSHLEDSVAAGQLCNYGVFTKQVLDDMSMRLPMDSLIGNAQKVGGDDHHMRAISLPFNVLNSNGLTLHNQVNNTVSMMDVAEKAGLLTLTHTPFNFIVPSEPAERLYRLVDTPSHKGTLSHLCKW